MEMHVLKCAQMLSCAASKLAAGLSKQLLERGGCGAADGDGSGEASSSSERSRIKQMIKQTSHWPESLPCRSSQVLTPVYQTK